MKEKNKNKKSCPSKAEDDFLDFDTVASATECTGLIPTPPASEAEAESYADMYAVPKPENKNNNGLQHK